MARSFDTDLAAALASGNVAIAIAAQFVFPEGTYGLWTGRGNLTWNAATYKGVDRFLSLSEMRQSAGNKLEGATLSLANVPSDMLDPDWIQTIENFSYDNAPLVLTWLGFDATTHALLGAMRTDRFEIDTITPNIGPVDDKGIRLATIEVAMETPRRNLSAANNVRRSPEDQKAFNDPDDEGLKDAVIGNRFQIKFGRISS
jgi:hypothetical protein